MFGVPGNNLGKNKPLTQTESIDGIIRYSKMYGCSTFKVVGHTHLTFLTVVYHVGYFGPWNY